MDRIWLPRPESQAVRAILAALCFDYIRGLIMSVGTSTGQEGQGVTVDKVEKERTAVIDCLGNRNTSVHSEMKYGLTGVWLCTRESWDVGTARTG